MGTQIKIILKSGKDQSLKRFHPWIFSGAIKTMTGSPKEGDLVEVVSNQNEFLALGHYQIGSIAIRVVSFENIEINYSFWKSKLEKAWQLRTKTGLAGSPENTIYRMVCAEGDGLPGLIIDYYNGTAVMQMHSIGMYRIREELAKALKDIYGSGLKAIYDKSESTIPPKAGINPKNEYLYKEGEPEKQGLEYGNKFIIDWEEGQKTGFFIDQRENRKLVGQFSKEKKVLNMFGYTGGFSVYAMKGGAELVHSVDSSAKAIELANKNIALNFEDMRRHEAFATDAFKYLENIKDVYDLIILDPPAFAKRNSALNDALQGYKRINAKAIEQLKPGGILFTFSCSQVVTKEIFRKSIFTAAANTGRNVRILYQLTQPADHPVNIYHPEGEYLKGFVVYVE